jgi:hypothetical protein
MASTPFSVSQEIQHPDRGHVLLDGGRRSLALKRLYVGGHLVTVNSQWQSASDEHWARPLAREAAIRPLTDHPELGAVYDLSTVFPRI